MGLSLRGRILVLVAVASLASFFIGSRPAFDAETVGSGLGVGNVVHHRASRRLLQDDDFGAGDSVAEDSVADDSVAEDSVAEDSVAEDSVAEDSVAEDAVADDSVAEDSVADDSVADDSVAEDSAADGEQEGVDPRRLRAQRHESASDDDGHDSPGQHGGTSHFLHEHDDKPVEISPTLAKRYRLMHKQAPEDTVVKPKLDPSLLPEDETPEETASEADGGQVDETESSAQDETLISENGGNAGEEPASDSVSTEAYVAALSEALQEAQAEQGSDDDADTGLSAVSEEEDVNSNADGEPAAEFTTVADVRDDSAMPEGGQVEAGDDEESDATPVAGVVHTEAHDEDPDESVFAFADSPSPSSAEKSEEDADASAAATEFAEDDSSSGDSAVVEESDATPVVGISHTEAHDEDPDDSIMAFADTAKQIGEEVRAAEEAHEAAKEERALLREIADALMNAADDGPASSGADAETEAAPSDADDDSAISLAVDDATAAEVASVPEDEAGGAAEETGGGEESDVAAGGDGADASDAGDGAAGGSNEDGGGEEVDESAMSFADQAAGASVEDGAAGVLHVSDDDAIEAAVTESVPENVDESGQVLFRLPVTDSMVAAEGDMEVGEHDRVVVPGKDVLGGGEVVAGDELADKEEEVANEDKPQPEEEALEEDQPLWAPHNWKHERADLYDAVGDEGLTCDGIVRQNDDGSLQALIANPREQAHASNLAMLPSGDLALAFFAGVENHDGCGIAFTKLPSGSFQWSTPAIVSEWPGHSAQNPVLFFDAEASKLFLLHTTQNAEQGQGTSSVLLLVSADEGATWSDPAPLFTQHGAFIRNQMLLSKINNDWLLPMYYTPSGMGGANIRDQYSAMKIYTLLPGATHGERHWEEHTMSLPGQYVVQPTVVRLRTNDDVLLAYYRDRKKKNIFMANSTDEGRTWSVAEPTPLPNNNKAIQACVLRNGNIVMTFGNNQGGAKWGPMAIALSEDDGKTWPYVRDLEDVYDEGLEYSYPSVLETPNGDIHVTYTWSYQVKRVTIRYKVVSEDWIRLGTTIGLYQPTTRPQPSLQAVEEEEPQPEESTSLLTGLAEELKAAVGEAPSEDDGARAVSDGGPDEISEAEQEIAQGEEEDPSGGAKTAYTTEPTGDSVSEDESNTGENEDGVVGLENV